MSRVWSAVLCLAATLSPGIAQPLDPALYADLRWRLVGPFRGGWGTVAEGVPDDPATYYLKDHYLNYPCVLVRLSRVRADALRDLVAGAHRFVTAKARKASRK